MGNVLFVTFFALCALVEIAYLIIRHYGLKELDRQAKEHQENIGYRSDLDFDFHVEVDRVRFGDEK